MRRCLASQLCSLLLPLSAKRCNQTPAKASCWVNPVMIRVTANQDRGEALRKQYLCKEHIHIVTRKPSRKLMREDIADYEIVPLGAETQKRLKLLAGRSDRGFPP